MQKNEARLCEIVVRLFEERTGAKREHVTYPERDNSSPPDARVEMRFDLSTRSYVIEHTRVEPFEGEIKAAKHFVCFQRPIREALRGSLPAPGVYELVFPIDPTAERPLRTHDRLRAAIIEWVRAAAMELHAEAPHRLGRNAMPSGYVGKRSSEICGLSLTLYRRVHWSEDGTHDGSLFFGRTIDADLEARRRRRIGIALDEKLGKLAAYAQRGDVAVLVLESSDISLSNHTLIGKAVEAELCIRAFRPDYIFIADTTLGDTCQLFCLVQDGNLSLDTEWIERHLP